MKFQKRKIMCSAIGMMFSAGIILAAASKVIAGNAGMAEDPLITLSYMQQRILPDFKEKLSSAFSSVFNTANRNNNLKSVGDSSVAALSVDTITGKAADLLLSKIPSSLLAPSVSSQRLIYLNSEKGLLANPGATLYILSGKLSLSARSGSVININSCSEIGSDTSFSAGQYVCVTEKNPVTFSSSEAKVLVTGNISFFFPMTGSLGIDGNNEYNSVLTADLTNVKYKGNLSYAWSVDGTTISTEKSCTVQESFIGKTVKLVVNCSGEGYGTLTAETEKITKAATSAPDAPKVKNVTWNSIELVAVEGMEYRMGSGSWQKQPVFNNLSENTSYKFTMRIAETATTGVSSASAALTVKTLSRAALTSSVYKVDIGNNRLSGLAAGTTAKTLIGNMDYPNNTVVSDASGKTVSETTKVGTNWSVSLVVDGTKTATVKIVVTGDVNGDGNADLTDYAQIKSHILGKKTLSGNALLAADVNGDGKVDLTDYAQLKSYILGKQKLTGRKF